MSVLIKIIAGDKMKISALEVNTIIKPFNIGSFRIQLEGENIFSQEGEWVGSNSALIYLDQVSGVWEIANYGRSYKLLLLDHTKLDRVSYKFPFHISINFDRDPHVLAVFDIEPRLPLLLGATDKGVIYKSVSLTYAATYKVIE